MRETQPCPPAASHGARCAVKAPWSRLYNTKGNHMTNCFDLRCPKCDNGDQIDVSASVWVRVTHDGTNPDLSKDGTHKWGDDSPTHCAACGHSGKVTDFRRNEYMAYFRTTGGSCQ